MSHLVARVREVRQGEGVPPTEDLPFTQRIADRYDVISPLGQGGSATTYLVRDVVHDSRLALKLLHSDRPSLVEALRAEFRLLQSIPHPHLCPVHDFGFLHPTASRANAPIATCFYTAEAIDGVTLDIYARNRSWRAALRPMLHALEALRLLHRLGIRHGDLKPENVLVRRDGSGVLVDLGCARPLDMPPAAYVSGTRAFLAPELLHGNASDARADLFAVGVTLQRLASVARSAPPKVHERLIARLTRHEPSERPNSVDEVLAALGAEPAPIPPAPTWRSRFVGREPQLAAAQRAMDLLLSDQPGPRVVCVSGRPGAGKTRLLQEIEWQTQPRCRVVRASASAPSPIEDLLSRALRRDIPPGQLSIVDALRELASPQQERLVLILDDVQRLADAHRQRLASVARLLEPTSSVLLLVSTTPDIAVDSDAIELVQADPLSLIDLELWLAPAFGAASIQAFYRLTGGYPDAVNAVLGLLRSGAKSEDDLQRMTEGVDVGAQRARQLRHQAPAHQRTVGLLALMGGQLGWGPARDLHIDASSFDALRDAGFVERHADGWKLTRVGESDVLVQHLPSRLRKSLHRELAVWWQSASHLPENAQSDPAGCSERAARVVFHLARGGRTREASELLREQEGALERAPVAWLDAVRALLLERGRDPVLALVAARLERASGHALDALARLDAIEESALSERDRVRRQAESGACHAALGDVRRAESHLHAAMTHATDPTDRLWICETLARTQIRRGEYAGARDSLRFALGQPTSTVDRARLLALDGTAQSFLGDAKQARARLREAIEVLADANLPQAHVRAITSLALHELREGNLEEASRGLEQALAVAQNVGLADHIANLSLNLGVVHHQRGAWDLALEAYEKGLRVAKALGARATETTLLCNLAKAQCDLGDFDRALQWAERGRALAERLALPLAVAAADTVLAEVEQARGRPDHASSRLASASAAFASSSSAAELAEVELQRVELAVQQRDFVQAESWLASCLLHPKSVDGRYLEARLSLVRARVLGATGQSSDAIRWAERAAEAFRIAHHRDAEAEAHLLLSELAADTGALHLSQQHLSTARALWERSASSLNAAAREAFWLHPKRSRARVTDVDATPTRSDGDGRLRKLLEVNKRLNSSLRTDDVLRAAMDAAIELTGAERGFVLVQEPAARGRAKLSVAVARNVDREQVGRSHLKFSRGIAQNVIRTGQAVLSTDAASDGRFEGEVSVHAMHLKSVACVPIHSPDGILGALYLDNRFQRGQFSPGDVELLLAFGDQVALALRSAQLIGTLEQRNLQLEAERRRVQELVDGQAAEIDRLHEQVRETHRSLTRRFDYEQIVGTSEPMQRVFDVLDRVTETSIPVLAQGESGTGKELIARALHYNGPRKAHRLVSINCAALPEPLLESELFGHVRGAFTGADRDREGLVVRAAGGTLFLDEVAELPLSMQAKLLRVLQEREVLPVGAARSVQVDFRLVCATNRILRDLVAQGGFREDLYYRIAVVEVRVPPLRERTEDIPALAAHILAHIATHAGGGLRSLSSSAMRKLMQSPWPGNVRQLENALTRAAVLARGEVIQAADIELPDHASLAPPPGRATYEQDEKATILRALEANRWNVRKVAPLLGLPRSTLYRKLKKHGIAVRAPKSG